MPPPSDNPSSAAVWTQNEECISWRDSPHGVAETERQPCLITGPINSTQNWWNTQTGVEQHTEILGVFLGWGVGKGMPDPLTVENRNNEILFRLKALQLCLSCHCLPGSFLSPCRLQIQTHIESFMHLSMTGWSPRRDSCWEFNEHVFLWQLSNSTDYHNGECEKVSDSQEFKVLCQFWIIILFDF